MEQQQEQDSSSRLARFASMLGGKLGVAVIGVGFVAIFLGWNGAASFNFLPQQLPYVISGGLAGLALVVVGAALLVVDGARSDRAALQASIEELRLAIETSGASTAQAVATAAGSDDGDDLIVLGASSFHTPSCRMVQGRDMPLGSREAAVADGMTACRICTP